MPGRRVFFDFDGEIRSVSVEEVAPCADLPQSR